jgi:hypothetical protein
MKRLALAGVLAALALVPEVVRADEVKSSIKPSMVLNIFSQPSELSARALGREMMEPGPPPASQQGGEVQPDGSVKYGSVTVTVRNPCPPGTAHYEPPPLPGRRVRQ